MKGCKSKPALVGKSDAWHLLRTSEFSGGQRETHCMVRIACLHTAESNIAVFDAALHTTGLAGVELHHEVRADLLAAAEREGRLMPEIASRTAEVLRGLCVEADVVLLTCSTLGPAAVDAPVPILRVDAALAAEAVKGGGRVVALCAVETTVEPTRLLFEAAARTTGAEVVVRVVAGAWEAFKASNRDVYLTMIAHAASEAAQSGAARVALAQASIAGACDLIHTGIRPLNNPVTGLAAAVKATAP